MLRRLVGIVSMVVGLLAWVAKAHAAAFWGYMLRSEVNGYGCMSCEPITSPVRIVESRPYDVYVQDLETHEWAAWENGRLAYVMLTNGWTYQITDTSFLHIGHEYMILLQRHSSSAGNCAIDICPYYVTYNGGELRFDVKMHSKPDENPLGGDSVVPNVRIWDNIKDAISLKWNGKQVVLYASSDTKAEVLVLSPAGEVMWRGRQSVRVGENRLEIPFGRFKGLVLVVVHTKKGATARLVVPAIAKR